MQAARVVEGNSKLTLESCVAFTICFTFRAACRISSAGAGRRKECMRAAQQEISGREVTAAQHDSGGLIQSGDNGLRAVALCIPPAATRELI